MGPKTAELSSTIPGCTNSAANPNGIPNTGNIWQIVDVLNGAATQNFNYDNMNRLVFFQQTQQLSSEAAEPQQNYSYDSFGNMNQSGTLNSALMFDANNRINAGGYGYDAAGNLASSNNGVSTTTYSYDAESKLANVNNGLASYTYDADGNRVRKDISPNWTEYVNFNGQTLGVCRS
jgi:YD repeat-containing protein